MSRTIRFRKDAYVPWWNDYSWWNDEQHDPKSKEGKKIWWKSHKDDRFTFKEPGPHWWRNLFDRQYRRKANREIGKYFNDPDYEPMIEKKPSLDYWT